MKKSSDEEARELIRATQDADTVIAAARAKLQKELDEFTEAEEAKQSVIYKERSDAQAKVYELDEQMTKSKNRVLVQEEVINVEMSQKSAELRGAREKLERIVRFIHLGRWMTGNTVEEDKKFDPELKLTAYSYGSPKPIEQIGELRNTAFTIIRAYLVENKRPKNKYQVEVVGRTIFSGNKFERDGNDIADLPKNYGSEINASGDNIHTVMGVGATRADALKQWDRSWKKVVESSEWFKSIIKAEAELQEVLDGKYSSVEWQRAYLLSRAKYFEENYSGGTSTPEYQAVVAELGGLGGEIDTSKEMPNITADEQRMNELEMQFESYIKHHPDAPSNYMTISIVLGVSDEYYALMEKFGQL
jgi:hypothetical protein